MTEWQPISTAPMGELIFVCWFQKIDIPDGGHWWCQETTLSKYVAREYPAATHWCYPNFPPFPDREVRP